MRYLIAVAALAALAGCYSPEYVREVYTEKCLNYGFEAGTVEHAECLQRETLAYEKRNSIPFTWDEHP